MRLIFSYLLSLSAHLALFFTFSGLFDSHAHAPTRPPLKITLRPAPDPALAPTDVISSTPKPSPLGHTSQAPQTSKPKHLRGPALQRAQASLSKHLFYPPLAVTQGLEGEVVLLLTLDTTGQIRAVDIAKSSGHVLLDDAALDAARHIGSLPGNPRQTLLPVTFRLQ